MGVNECTCTQPEYNGPGTVVSSAGVHHQRGCPEIQWFYDIMDTNEHLIEPHGGGFILSPGEQEARRLECKIENLERQIRELQDSFDDVMSFLKEVSAHISERDGK